MDEETAVELALEEAEPEEPAKPIKTRKKRTPSPVLPILWNALVSLVAGALLVVSAIFTVEAVRAAVNDPGNPGTLQRVDPAAIAAAVSVRSNTEQSPGDDSQTAAPPAETAPAGEQEPAQGDAPFESAETAEDAEIDPERPVSQAPAADVSEPP